MLEGVDAEAASNAVTVVSAVTRGKRAFVRNRMCHFPIVDDQP